MGTKKNSDEQLIYVTALRSMTLASKGKWVNLGGSYLTEFVSKRSEIERILNPSVVEIMGTGESDFIKKSKLVLISRTRLSKGELEKSGNPAKFFDIKLKNWRRTIVSHLLLAGWCVKDHSIQPDTSFLFVKSGDDHLLTSSHVNGVRTMNSKGKAEDTAWSGKEVQKLFTHLEALNNLVIPHYSRDKVRPATTAIKGIPRTARFFFLLQQAALRQWDLGFRIAFFIQSLEMLFGTAKTELSYRLSLQLAVLMGEDLESRKAYFKILKRCYAVRSTMLHGDTFRPIDIEKMEDLSRDLEVIVRVISCRILENAEFSKLINGKSENLDEHLADKLLQAGLDES